MRCGKEKTEFTHSKRRHTFDVHNKDRRPQAANNLKCLRSYPWHRFDSTESEAYSETKGPGSVSRKKRGKYCQIYYAAVAYVVVTSNFHIIGSRVFDKDEYDYDNKRGHINRRGNMQEHLALRLTGKRRAKHKSKRGGSYHGGLEPTGSKYPGNYTGRRGTGEGKECGETRGGDASDRHAQRRTDTSELHEGKERSGAHERGPTSGMPYTN
eukprot:7910691-Heterocapsa_arctica.AAC.1